jgi:hypothetical protein
VSQPLSIPCPRCGSPASGKFCASCGMTLSRLCTNCATALAADAKFCAHCGAPSGGSVAQAQAMMQASASVAPWLTPWRIVEVMALVAAVAVIWAVSRAGKESTVGGGAAPAAAAQDISNLPPREEFGRLADRVETAMEGGDTATVVKFFPMAETAFANLTTTDRDIDARFHVSLLRARIGHFPAGLAQVDSIAAIAPTHLFVYYLKAIINDFQNDTVAARKARQAFREHYDKEIATNRTEYQAHRQMLDQFFKSIPVVAKK